MKKFKHKKTGDIAELVSNSGYKLNQSTIGLIPQEYIENSSDWEEIKENGHRFSPGDKVYRVWGSGAKTLGVITDDNRFKALESYDNEGGVINGDIYGLGKYEYELAKDYQILSFSCIKGWGTNLATLRDDGLYKLNKNSWGWDLNLLLNEGVSVKSGDIKIHSVKRLSDDEVFTIGDRCKKGIITEFGILELHDELAVEFDNKCCTTNLNSDWCSKLQPLFTTEDGVDVYEGDRVWYFNKEYKLWNSNADPKYHNGKKDFIYFSTREAAENYIISNKPCLSFNDVWNISNNKDTDTHYMVVDKRKLKELVKSKL